MKKRRPNPMAKDLRQPKYRQRVVPDKKKPIPKRKLKYKGSMGNDLTVVNAARVSFGKESEWDYEESDGYSFKQHMKLKDKKLIKYLAKHKHISPFGHCFASYLVRCPVFVERQLVKHSYLRMNQISRRY